MESFKLASEAAVISFKKKRKLASEAGKKLEVHDGVCSAFAFGLNPAKQNR